MTGGVGDARAVDRAGGLPAWRFTRRPKLRRKKPGRRIGQVSHGCGVVMIEEERSMDVEDRIENYIGSQAAPRIGDMRALHRIISEIMPGCRMWFLDGKNDEGRIVSNPNIGYGFQTIKYADGRTRDFYRIGMSANTTGLSVYILGIDDKNHLANAYGDRIGRASVTGYCIKFKSLKDIDTDVLESAIRYGLGAQNQEAS
jgi:hypothetical protein